MYVLNADLFYKILLKWRKTCRFFIPSLSKYSQICKKPAASSLSSAPSMLEIRKEDQVPKSKFSQSLPQPRREMSPPGKAGLYKGREGTPNTTGGT